MSSTLQKAMTINIKGLELARRERLRERLDRAAQLRCADHGQPIVGVTIYGRENGWFDSRWTTCCEGLEQQAVAIVKKALLIEPKEGKRQRAEGRSRGACTFLRRPRLRARPRATAHGLLLILGFP